MPPATRLAPANLALVFIFGFQPASSAEAEWQVPEAALRYKVALGRRSPAMRRRATTRSCRTEGSRAAQTPNTTVMTEGGKLLPSFLLWQNPESGFSLVFADPGDSSQAVYVYTANRSAGRNTETQLRAHAQRTPRGQQPARDNIEAAQRPREAGPGGTEHARRGESGIPTGRRSASGATTPAARAPAAFYLLTYVDAPRMAATGSPPSTSTGCD